MTSGGRRRAYDEAMEHHPSATESAGKADSMPLPAHITRNIADIVDLYQAETASMGRAQRRLETFGAVIARPAYFLAIFLVVGAWIAINLDAKRLGVFEFDPPPFAWLQGFLAFVALMTATVVLIGQ